MRKIASIGIFLFISLLQGQNCDCLSTFNWVKDTFEKNDAGFSHIINSKGKDSYEKLTSRITEITSTINDNYECRDAITNWLSFFRSGHLRLRVKENRPNDPPPKEPSEIEIIEKFKNWDTLDFDLVEFKKYLNDKKDIDFEGIWVNGPYEIGIKKVNDNYEGFIIKADGIYWRAGQLKLKIKKDSSSIYYMRDHSVEKFNTTKMLGNNFLEMGFVTLERKFPVIQKDQNIERYYRLSRAEKPFIENVNQNTLLIRIPSFSGRFKKDIDSVIANNRNRILNTKNLIIDLRDNGGGSDRSFQSLIPIIYTNPIRSIGVEYLSTKLNNQRMLDFIEDPSYNFTEEDKKWAKESYDKLDKNIGKFVNLKSRIVSITNFKDVHRYPENVGIIINSNNASTSEQFLLLAKQSKKVKLFGTVTDGILDISNMYFVESPCGDFELGYGLSRSMRIPEITVDSKGISPDYYMDEKIPKYKWVEYVSYVLNH